MNLTPLITLCCLIILSCKQKSTLTNKSVAGYWQLYDVVPKDENDSDFLTLA
jgi:hypothetical protein